MAGTTGLEPATSAVTGQRSNQLSYVPNLNQFDGYCANLPADRYEYTRRREGKMIIAA